MREEWFGVSQKNPKKTQPQSIKSIWIVNNFGTKTKQQNLLQCGLLMNYSWKASCPTSQLINQVCFIQRRKKILLKLSETPIFFQGKSSVAYYEILVFLISYCIFIHKARMWRNKTLKAKYYYHQLLEEYGLTCCLI